MLPNSDVIAEDWRLVSLMMTKENGGAMDVQLLRPLEWFLTEHRGEARSAVSPFRFQWSQMFAGSAGGPSVQTAAGCRGRLRVRWSSAGERFV
jgi:hypothetical protein